MAVGAVVLVFALAVLFVLVGGSVLGRHGQELVAGEIGIDRPTYLAELRAGRTMEEVAGAYGKDPEQIRQRLVEYYTGTRLWRLYTRFSQPPWV